ncbi:MAG TPA: Rne/Rng family ribonuclease [Candidatus Polarisedimenticolaceae bacterium]|nr:Rne/Rng family ribonuclease [Candidatus Polarisedimenticolaceae bacterium]
MSKTMLVNVTHAEESRVAILENGVLADYEIETSNRASLKGNIYNAVVENVIPSLEAAFVRLGGDLKGFLPLDEVNFKLLPSRGEARSRGRIGQHLHSGQRLMVQVVREPFAGKPPTVSTYFSLPGRYLVLMPGVDSSGVSRKIEDSGQRDKLKKIVEELKPPEGFGLIVRTAGMGQTKTELQRDLRYLLRLWESVQRASRAAEFPGLVYRERDLVIRTIRDHFTPDIDEVWIDSPEVFERASEFFEDVVPTKAKVLKLYSGDRPLFNKFNLEEQIESIYKRRVPLPSGGEIVIDGTEALTAVDVNTRGSARSGEAEDAAVQTNLEAAAEIGRQMRLRDLGGLFVIDFIDMMKVGNQKKVEKAMRDAMKGDKARYDVTRISKLGLLEIARQRIKGEKMGASYATCLACEGYGLVKNVESAALSALRKLQARCTRGDFGRMRMGVPNEVAVWILNNKREELVALERRHNIKVVVEGKASLRRHEAEFETSPRERVEAPPALAAPDRSLPPLPPDAAELKRALQEEGGEPAESETPAPGMDTEGPSEGGGKRRRRRRRGGRGRGRGSAVPESADEEEIAAVAPDPVPAVAAAAGENGEWDGEGGEGADTDGDPALAEDAEPATGEPRRRKRRRRRRGRGVPAGEAAAQPPGNGVHEPVSMPPPPPAPRPPREQTPAEDEGVFVPKHVRADQLMPAAVGRTGEQRPAGGGGRGRGRRRRRGGGDGGGLLEE